MWLCVWAFILAFIVDAIWIWYYRAISDNKPFVAANFSILIVICSLFGSWLLIDKEYAALVTYIIGGYIGTYLAVRYGNKNDS